MKYYLYKLILPRPSFFTDETPAESKIMQDHVAYWTDLMNRGLAVVFGPVSDPEGAYGIGVLQLEEREDPQAIGRGDPAIMAGIGFAFETYPMPNAVARPASASV